MEELEVLLVKLSRALAVLLKDLGSIPKIHMVAHNYLKTPVLGGPVPFLASSDSRHAHGTQTN